MVEENQPQDVVAEEAEKVGAETSQLTEPIEQQQLGAEQPQEEPKPRLYSQEEWSKRESAKDTEIAGIRDQMAQLNMASDIAKAQHTEELARSKDQKEVDEGTISASEATQREQARVQQRQAETTVSQQQQMLRQMSQQTEQYGRVLAAQDFGKEYELTSEQVTELLSDKEVRTPGDMRAKAANLALEKVRGELKKSKEKPEKFDQGQKGGGETSTPEKALKTRYPTMFKK